MAATGVFRELVKPVAGPGAGSSAAGLRHITRAHHTFPTISDAERHGRWAMASLKPDPRSTIHDPQQPLCCWSANTAKGLLPGLETCVERDVRFWGPVPNGDGPPPSLLGRLPVCTPAAGEHRRVAIYSLDVAPHRKLALIDEWTGHLHRRQRAAAHDPPAHLPCNDRCENLEKVPSRISA
jgi:hypothetical protein